MIRSKKITQSAKGESCTLQIAGVCNGLSDTVVFCHFPDESHGMSLKADDIAGGYGCSDCHDVVDGRRRLGEWYANKDFYMRRSQTRTLRRLIEKGVIKIA